ncbi:fungal-specific transcription factor domain-containing protein, partial [Thelonectria olida]
FPPDGQTRQQCIDTYFSRFHRVWPTVHRSTFTTESKNQDLVDSVVMIGAWLSGIDTWMEMALRLHKSVMDRLAAKLFDFSSQQGARSRWPVPTYQALLLNVIFALQSSDDMLFSTAYLQHSTMVAVFRDAGFFQEKYSLAEDDLKDAIPSGWLERETLKRLAYLAFRLDIYFYFLRGFRPTLRYDELYLTLPCSERLWEVQTLEEWHRVKRIESKKRSAIYFVNLVDQAMDQEGRARLPPLLEDEYLYGLCAMQAWLWEDVQRHRSRKETRNTLLAPGSFYPAYFSRSIDYWTTQLTTWRECYRDRALGSTLSSKSHRETCDISAVPLYHLSQIVLRANLQAIKQLSSEQGHQSNSGTFMRQLEASTLEWVKTSDARLAIWHAAKVLKLVQEKTIYEVEGSDVACATPPLELIASIALYEAGLVVWAYTRSVQVCDACVIGSSLQAASSEPDPFELFGTDQDQSFLEWL